MSPGDTTARGERMREGYTKKAICKLSQNQDGLHLSPYLFHIVEGYLLGALFIWC